MRPCHMVALPTPIMRPVLPLIAAVIWGLVTPIAGAHTTTEPFQPPPTSGCTAPQSNMTVRCWLARPDIFYQMLIDDLPGGGSGGPNIPADPPPYRPITTPRTAIIVPLPPPPPPPPARDPPPPSPEVERPPESPSPHANLSTDRGYVAHAFIDRTGYHEVTMEEAVTEFGPIRTIPYDTPAFDERAIMLQWPRLVEVMPVRGMITHATTMTIICDCGAGFTQFDGDAVFTIDVATGDGGVHSIDLIDGDHTSLRGAMTFFAIEMQPSLFTDPVAQLHLALDGDPEQWDANLYFGITGATPTPIESLQAVGTFTAGHAEDARALLGYFGAVCDPDAGPCGAEN